MKKFLKGVGYFFIGVLVFFFSIYLKSYWSTEKRLCKKYVYTQSTLALSQDSSLITEGKRLVTMKACGSCHGDDLGGKVWMDSPLLGQIIAPNLTKGKGGLPPDYNTSDWARALHHGLKADSTPLIIMPAQEFTKLNEQDLIAIIAYCSQLKPIDREFPKSKLGFLAYLLTEFDQIPLIPAEQIDHTISYRTESIVKAVSFEFGKYLSSGCEGCHRPTMKGGPPLAPGLPTVPDITTTGNPGKWTEDQFINTLKRGVTPEGKVLNPAEMPWKSFTKYTEVELKALYKFLRSL